MESAERRRLKGKERKSGENSADLRTETCQEMECRPRAVDTGQLALFHRDIHICVCGMGDKG
jgi:hypothetical protein